MGRQTTLLVTLRGKKRARRNHAGSCYGSARLDHAANGEPLCRDQGQEQSGWQDTERSRPGKSRAGTGSRGAGAEGSGTLCCLTSRLGASEAAGAKAGEPQGQGAGKEDALFLSTQQ